jgi:hypothetical protein
MNHQFERLVQQVSRSHVMMPRHSYRLEECKSTSGGRLNDPSQVLSKTLHSTAF